MGTQKKKFTDKSKGFLLSYHVFTAAGYEKDHIEFLLKKNKFFYVWLTARSWNMPMKVYPNFTWPKTPYVWQYLQTYLMCDVLQLADVLVGFME